MSAVLGLIAEHHAPLLPCSLAVCIEGIQPPRSVKDYELFFRATFLPFLRASDRPIAIACFLLVTFFPLFPLLSVPLLRRRIADSTSFEALFEVFRFDVLRAAMS